MVKYGGVDLKIDMFKLEVLLAAQGLTKTDLAMRCGVSRQSISTIVRRGTCEPRTAGKLAAGLGVGVAEITKGEVY